MSALPCSNCDGWGCRSCGVEPGPRGEQSDVDLREIDAAVAAEREACAQMLDTLAADAKYAIAECAFRDGAAAIRARSKA